MSADWEWLCKPTSRNILTQHVIFLRSVTVLKTDVSSRDIVTSVVADGQLACVDPQPL